MLGTDVKTVRITAAGILKRLDVGTAEARRLAMEAWYSVCFNPPEELAGKLFGIEEADGLLSLLAIAINRRGEALTLEAPELQPGALAPAFFLFQLFPRRQNDVPLKFRRQCGLGHLAPTI